MRHFDYEWDLEPWGIVLDPELNIDRLGWKSGDLFEVANINGKVMLHKVDPVVAFAKGYNKVNYDE